MKKNDTKQDNVSGSILLVSLIFLLILSVIGISGIQTATNDLEITRSHRIYNENFYLADGAAYEAVQQFANNSTLKEASPGTPSWLYDISSRTSVNPKDFNWSSLSAKQSSLSSDVEYVVYKNSTEKTFYVYSRSSKSGGRSFVEIKFTVD